MKIAALLDFALGRIRQMTAPTEIILGPLDFQSSRDGSFFKYQYRSTTASELLCMNNADEAGASFVVPVGCKATKIIVYGTSTEIWTVARQDPANNGGDLETTGGVVGTEKDITHIPYAAGMICYLEVSMTAGDHIHGAKITLESIDD